MDQRGRLPSAWSAHPGNLLPWLMLLPLFALLAWFYLPVTRGDFVADDYVFLVTSRMVDTPLDAFWQSHFYEPYYFRPIGLLSWWAMTRLFGLDYAAHSLFNLFLHLANSGLLMGLLRALTVRASGIFTGVALFTLGPFALATILWPSNRFDLLAVGFLLMQAIAMVRALQGSAFAIPLAMLAALAACWSKELAYPVATTMALVGLAANGVLWQRRAMIFALQGLAIGGAFFVRHATVTGGYALVSADPFAQIFSGATTMILSAAKLTDLILGADQSSWFGWGSLGAVLVALAWKRRDAAQFTRLIGGATLVLVAAFIVQTPLANAFAPMLDGSPFGTITFARFYYAPWLIACVMVALLVTRAQLSSVAALTIVCVTVATAFMAKPLSQSFATWTRNEIKPASVAATRTLEEGVTPNQPCVFVLLGTQTQHPYFRMFSDVTVKARTTMPEKVWRCHVLTESTPWLFAFPSSVMPLDLPLRFITNPDGSAKLDATWSSIRYRYRLPAMDLTAIPGVRFFDWREGVFVEVSDEVRLGQRKVTAQDW